MSIREVFLNGDYFIVEVFQMILDAIKEDPTKELRVWVHPSNYPKVPELQGLLSHLGLVTSVAPAKLSNGGYYITVH